MSFLKLTKPLFVATPTVGSQKAVLFISSLVSIFVYVVYSAVILTSLLEKTSLLPFSDLESLVRDGSYKFIILYDAPWRDYFVSNTNRTDETTRLVIKALKDSEVESSDEAYFQVRIE